MKKVNEVKYKLDYRTEPIITISNCIDDKSLRITVVDALVNPIDAFEFLAYDDSYEIPREMAKKKK
jgi:hypothetical protein